MVVVVVAVAPVGLELGGVAVGVVGFGVEGAAGV